MRQHREIVIISACTGQDNDNINTDKLRAWLTLQKFNFKAVNGCYKDTREESFLVVLDKPSDLDYLIFLGSELNQECILYSNYRREAFLIDGEGDRTKLRGSLRRVFSTQGLDAFTEVDGELWAITA